MRLFEFTEDKGSYAAVTFCPETVKAIEAFQYDNEIPNPLNPDDFHSTVMFSRDYIPNFEVLEGPLDWQGRFEKFTVFPSDDTEALVLVYECHELKERWQKIMDEYDATWDYEQFIPHVTLSNDIEGLDIDKLPAYKVPITIVAEYNEDLDLSVNWADQHK